MSKTFSQSYFKVLLKSQRVVGSGRSQESEPFDETHTDYLRSKFLWCEFFPVSNKSYLNLQSVGIFYTVVRFQNIMYAT